MSNRLPSPSEQEQLSYLMANFRLTEQPSLDGLLTVPSEELLDASRLTAYLNRLDTVFPSCSNTVKASLFAKRYSYMTISSSLYAMTMHDRALDYSIGNCSIESVYRDGKWLPNLRLSDWTLSEPKSGQREKWREAVVRNLFAENLGKLWRVLSAAAPISSATLWENTAVSVYWLYEKRMGDEADDRQKSRMREDFDYLLNGVPAAWLGGKKNPLSRFHSPMSKAADSEQPVRVRTTCCLYYQTSSTPSYCSVCPMNRQRDERETAKL